MVCVAFSYCMCVAICYSSHRTLIQGSCLGTTWALALQGTFFNWHFRKLDSISQTFASTFYGPGAILDHGEEVRRDAAPALGGATVSPESMPTAMLDYRWVQAEKIITNWQPEQKQLPTGSCRAFVQLKNSLSSEGLGGELFSANMPETAQL